MQLDLPPLSVKGRIERVQAALEKVAVRSLLVTDLTNVRWCSGFRGSAGVLVIHQDSSLLITDHRYRDQAQDQLKAAGSQAQVCIESDWIKAATEALNDSTAVALEADQITWKDQSRLLDALTAELVPTVGVIAELRSVKDAAEVSRIETAANIVDAVFKECRNQFVAGISERQLARMLEDGMRASGADGPAYETIVAAGPNAALPHARASDRCLTDGDLLVIDAGALVDGYRSDMTRTFFIGTPDDQSLRIHDLVTRAQAAGVAAVCAGVEAAQVDKACRDLISEAGYGEAFLHGSGHGVGLDIHELPALRHDNSASLSAGQVVTVEPGIYLSGYGGVRVEDTVLVTEDGCRPLTKYPKES